MPTKKKISALMRKYNAIKKMKARNCQGKATAAAVKKAAKAYITAAIKKGQTRKEATRKANAITTRACGMGAVAPKRRKRRKR